MILMFFTISGLPIPSQLPEYCPSEIVNRNTFLNESQIQEIENYFLKISGYNCSGKLAILQYDYGFSFIILLPRALGNYVKYLFYLL